MKKLDLLFAECNSRAYQCDIRFCQNSGLAIRIETKYLKGGNQSGIPKILYESDSYNNSKTMIKEALDWIHESGTKHSKKIGTGRDRVDSKLLSSFYQVGANKYLLAFIEDSIEIIDSKTEDKRQEFESFLANMRCIASDGMQVAKNRVELIRYILKILQKYKGKVWLSYPYTKMLPLDSLPIKFGRVQIPSQRHHIERTRISLGSEA